MPTDEYEYTDPPAHMTLHAVAQRLAERLTAFYATTYTDEAGVQITHLDTGAIAVRDPSGYLITVITLTETDSALSVVLSDCEHPARPPTDAELQTIATLPAAEQFAAKARLARDIQAERRVTLRNRRAAREVARLMVEQVLEDMRKEANDG